MAVTPTPPAVTPTPGLTVGLENVPLRTILLAGFATFPASWVVAFFGLQGQARPFTFLMLVLAGAGLGVWTYRGVWVGRLALNAAARTLGRVFRLP